MTINQPDPDQRAALVEAELKKIADAQARCRVIAVDLCLKFRNLMIDDPSAAMFEAEKFSKALAHAGRTYKHLQQAARLADEAMGEIRERRGINHV